MTTPTPEVHNTAVALSLTIDIDLAAWAYEYHLDGGKAAARDDVRAAVAGVVEEHLRNTLGFTGAAVRVGTSYRRSALRP